MAAGGSGAGAANLWQSLLLNPQLGAVQQELGRLVSAIVIPIVGELISQPQARNALSAEALHIRQCNCMDVLIHVLYSLAARTHQSSVATCRWPAAMGRRVHQTWCRRSASALLQPCSPASQSYRA